MANPKTILQRNLKKAAAGAAKAKGEYGGGDCESESRPAYFPAREVASPPAFRCRMGTAGRGAQKTLSQPAQETMRLWMQAGSAFRPRWCLANVCDNFLRRPRKQPRKEKENSGALHGLRRAALRRQRGAVQDVQCDHWQTAGARMPESELHQPSCNVQWADRATAALLQSRMRQQSGSRQQQKKPFPLDAGFGGKKAVKKKQQGRKKIAPFVWDSPEV